MSVYHPYPVKCPKGHSFILNLARGVNVKRTPVIKQQILDGSFHRFKCPQCSIEFTVEKSFSYADIDANAFFLVKPRTQYFNWKEASRRLEMESAKIPNKISNPKTRQIRVVYGLAELREKLLCEKYQLNDKMVELAKVILLYDHPFLLNRSRLQFKLNKVNENILGFTAIHQHEKRTYHLNIDKEHIQQFAKNEAKLKAWVKKSAATNNVFDAKQGHYVNYRRWLPQAAALLTLSDFARDAQEKKPVNANSKEFKNMLLGLPRGSHLSIENKNNLSILEKYARKKDDKKMLTDLFDIRFDKELGPDFWKENSANKLDTLWQLFEDLPDNQIENNSRMHEITTEADNGGTYDSTTNEIDIGIQIRKNEDFEDTIRHEVGHSVHEKYRPLIDKWLFKRFGWKSFPKSKAGLDEWIAQMGGWGSMKVKEQKEVHAVLNEAFRGKGSWIQGILPKLRKDHPWNQKKFGPCLVYKGCDNDWYETNEKWYRYEGKAFFLNYYYDEFYMVNSETLDLVNKMPSRYAAMSADEFFAELYALYYDKNDPLRKVIPADVLKWMKEHLG